jgi:hypothetical protein
MQDLIGSHRVDRIFSPQPKRVSIRAMTTCQLSPYLSEYVESRSLNSPPTHFEDEEVNEELNSIITPIKSVPAPSRKSIPLPTLSRCLTWDEYSQEATPPREKSNPIIFDELFMELNSTISTAESTPPRSFSPDNCA